MQARYVILQVLLEAGENLVAINKIVDEDGKETLKIQLDEAKIPTVGKDAIGKFLQRLQVCFFWDIFLKMAFIIFLLLLP